MGYTIPIVRDDSPKHHGAFGYWDLQNQAIFIDSELDGMIALATFFHELCHAIDDLCGLRLKHNQIEGLGNGLAQAILGL